jgi:hypothetical protein
MDGTRKSCLKEIVDWVANKSDLLQSTTYLDLRLTRNRQNGVSSFDLCEPPRSGAACWGLFLPGDDPNLSEPRNILPTLIYKLAGFFPPFRTIVAQFLSNDPNLTPESMKDSLFLDLLDNLPKRPNDFLVFVIDAFDECGDDRSRLRLLKLLTDAATRASWLKIIITSRPEADIQNFFDTLSRSSYLRYDLATDKEANNDLRAFAQSEFDWVGRKWFLSPPWPEESLLNRVISQANGLFTFIKTLVLALELCEDPTELLRAIAEDSAETTVDEFAHIEKIDHSSSR